MNATLDAASSMLRPDHAEPFASVFCISTADFPASAISSSANFQPTQPPYWPPGGAPVLSRVPTPLGAVRDPPEM